MSACEDWPSESLNVIISLRKGARRRHEEAIVARYEYQEGDGGPDSVCVDAGYLTTLLRRQLSAGKILRSIDRLIDALSVVESQEARKS